MVRYFAYIEACDVGEPRMSSLWAGYQSVTRENFASRRVARRSEIYPVFRELFKRAAA